MVAVNIGSIYQYTQCIYVSSNCSIYVELCTDRSDVDALCVLEVGGEGGEQSVEAPVVEGVGNDNSPQRPRGEDAHPRSACLGKGHRGGEREEEVRMRGQPVREKGGENKGAVGRERKRGGR